MSGEVFQYDESDWPIVRVVSPSGRVEDAMLARNFERMAGYLERRQPLVFIIELGTGTALSVQQRDQIRRHEEQHRDLIAQFQRGIGIVIRSTFQRAMIGAIFWLIRSPSPTETFADVESAKLWARALLGQRQEPLQKDGPRLER